MKKSYLAFSGVILAVAVGVCGLRIQRLRMELKDALTSSAASASHVPPAASEPIAGYADLHIHMMAELGYGGAWFHGSHSGPEQTAMASCSGNAQMLFGKPGDHGATSIPVLSEFLGSVPGSAGDTGVHLGRKKGYPSYEEFPRWDTIAHQQVWEGFLRDAHERGLNLIVLSAVNFKPLCSLMPIKNRKYDCDDMTAVERQLQAAHQFTRTHPWAEIALSSSHARTIVRQGKLAIILAIEVSDLFSGGDWKTQFEHVYQLGVRSLQPVHQLDNRFAGAAPHHFIFKFFQILRDLKLGTLSQLGFELDSNGKNRRGLTEEGRELVREMMNHRMLIDLAHLSEKGIRDTYAITSEAIDPYPVYISHGHFRELVLGKMEGEEKTTPDWVIELLKTSGGMFGVRTGSEDMKSYGKVPNDCAGSTKTFAQMYQYGDLKLQVPLAFGSDLNGFIQQLRPRFGEKDETCGAASTKELRNRQQAAQKNPLGTKFDRTGFGHIGQIGEIIQELKNFGVDTHNIENSADHFVRMWERAERWENPTATRSLATDASKTDAVTETLDREEN